MFDFCIVFLLYIFVYSLFCNVFTAVYIVSPFVLSLSHFFYKTTDHCHRLETQLPSINIIIITVGFMNRNLPMGN
jgi:hypothetical protein